MARRRLHIWTAATLSCAVGCAHCDTCDDFPAPANVSYGGFTGQGHILAPTQPLMVGQETGMPIDAGMSAPHGAVIHSATPPAPSTPPAGSGGSGDSGAAAAGTGDVKQVPSNKDETTPPTTPDPSAPKTGDDAKKGADPLVPPTNNNSDSGAQPRTDSGATNTAMPGRGADEAKKAAKGAGDPIVPLEPMN